MSKTKSKYPYSVFIVEILLFNNVIADKVHCIGLDDVHNFVEEKRKKYGPENYSGYRTQVVKLSNYASDVITKGVCSLYEEE